MDHSPDALTQHQPASQVRTACLPVRLPAYLHACLPACLPACQATWLLASLLAYL